MTEFVLRGTSKGDQLTIEQINDKVNSCIDWTKLRSEGITLEDATFDTAPEAVKVWTLLAAPGTNEVTAERCNGICFVEVYQGDGEQVFNAIANQHVTNGGDLVVTLKDHEATWLVRVIRP